MSTRTYLPRLLYYLSNSPLLKLSNPCFEQAFQDKNNQYQLALEIIAYPSFLVEKNTDLAGIILVVSLTYAKTSCLYLFPARVITQSGCCIS